MPYQSLGMMQQQRQVQTLAPQMRQSLEILQLPMMELRALIQHEMEQNPVIEDVTSAQELVVDTMADSSPDLERMAKTALEDSRRDHDEAVASDDGDDLLGEAPAPGKDAGNAQLDFDKDTLRDIGSDDAGYLFDDDQVSQPFTKEAQERRQYMFDSLTQTVSLQQHLLDQLVASDLSLEDKQIGEMIIGGLNDDGFLTVSLDDLADQTAFPKERIEHVLRVVQTFDPPGIAARDGRECLLLQLEGLDTPGADLARAIVSRYLKEFSQKKFEQIAAALGCTVEDVEQASKIILHLNPKPASALEGETADYITPEVFVDRDPRTGRWTVRIDDDQLPRIHISSTYRRMLDNPGVQAETKSYIRERMRAGQFLLKSIERRQQTIYSIATAIVDAQQDFLTRGVAFLRPMTMAEVAAQVGVSETTVSRTVANKYMKTPRGVFELKYFFSTGIQTESGPTLSNKTVQDRIAAIVRAEDPDAPLSDQAIMEKLAEEGIKIARRTVVKYRKIQKIPSSDKRRRL